MPELPEAETMARQMAAETVGWKISQVLVNFAPIVATGPKSFPKLLTGKKILAVRRHGKWIIFDLSDDHNLLVHLKMTGQFHFGSWPPESEQWPKHCHAAFHLKNNALEEKTFFYKDTRKFGRLRAFGPGQLALFLEELNLGPDALRAGPQEYHQRLTSVKGQLKVVLLDQQILAGFGNIYVDETLLAAKLSPKRSAQTLSEEETACLYEKAQTILQKAIDCQGSTVYSYQAPQGAGSYQNFHLAYGQAGKPCPFCGKNLEKIKVAGRTTVYCPYCQS
jgi:formamidopyrimidine-DNA glycosylase